MASTQGVVPITKEFLASYYDKHPFEPLSDDFVRLSSEIRSMASDLLNTSPPSQDERLLVEEADREPVHKIDENFWKNREHMEEILYLLDCSRWPESLKQSATPEDSELASVLAKSYDSFQKSFKNLVAFQVKNSDRVFNTAMSYIPQDFWGTLIRQGMERLDRNEQAKVDALVNSGASIQARYALLWEQQMERRRQLAQLDSATGIYQTLVNYLVGVPQVLLDFIRTINDDDGPMEEQRKRYGPPLHDLTSMILSIRLFLSLLWGRHDATKLKLDEINVLRQTVDAYVHEFERFVAFISEVFADSPFFISAEVAGALQGRNNDDFKETIVSAGKTREVIMAPKKEQPSSPKKEQPSSSTKKEPVSIWTNVLLIIHIIANVHEILKSTGIAKDGKKKINR